MTDTFTDELPTADQFTNGNGETVSPDALSRYSEFYITADEAKNLIAEAAAAAVFLDNFNAKELKSDILASVLTENPAMVRVMGQTKNVPLHTRTFVAITGNGVVISEDMVRRLVLCNLNANMPDPEQRKFAPGFLQRIYDTRRVILKSCLTIWRWGRQNKMPDCGVAMGSYEQWCQWCRDPLIGLGCNDPFVRVDEIKAADPMRRQLGDVFETWWEKHGDAVLKANEINADVIELIDQKSSRGFDGKLNYNRHYVSMWLQRHEGTSHGEYQLKIIREAWRKRKQIMLKLERTAGQ